ncbi:MAG: hypothetical protein ABSG81_15095 [Acidimicrobiales bacterium]
MSGSTTLSTIGEVTSNAPYSSGQNIDVSVAANSTLDLSNLEANGYTGEPAMKAVECADPDGLSSNLPSTPTGHCDGQTILSTSAVNSDGSFVINDYTVYALPDNATFGEGPNSTPVCGVGTEACVLYLGPAQNDFSKPHLFSAPFYTYPNGDDGGENPGDGNPQSSQAISFTSTPANPSVVGTTYTPTATGGGSGNAVTFSIDATSTSGACTYSAPTVTFTGPGTCVIDANQAGDFAYTAAPQVRQSATVENTQAITFTSTPPSPADVGGTYTPTANGGGSGNSVTFSIDATSTAGACTYSAPTVSFTGPGTCVIDANQAGNASYEAAPQVSQNVGIGVQSQTIHFTTTPPSPAVEGGSYTPHATGGGSSNPVVFSIGSGTTAGACSISAGVVHFTGAGTCVIAANQAGNAQYAAAAQVTQSASVATTGFTSANHATATVGDAFTFPVTAGGPTAPKISEKGKLPKDVKFFKGTGSASISGTPTSTKHKSAAGTYTLTQTATYGKGKTKQVVTQTFTLTVNP